MSQKAQFILIEKPLVKTYCKYCNDNHWSGLTPGRQVVEIENTSLAIGFTKLPKPFQPDILIDFWIYRLEALQTYEL